MAKKKEPTLPTHPGELLNEELEIRMISKITFSDQLGVSHAVMKEILYGNRPMTCDIALLVEAAWGIDSELLVSMQGRYNLALARLNPDIGKQMKNVRKVFLNK